jgi:hypothetical protein
MDTATDALMDTPAVASYPESPELAAVLTGAVETAQAAIVEFSGDTVGEYLGVTFEDTNAATHRFLAELPGYRGWQWAVVVAACPGADHATVSEVVLVPGPTAMLAPQWVPWEERVRPGDLGPGDLLAPPADDPRLVPGYALSGDSEIDETAAEVGLGRKRVLSAWGRADAAQRWHDGEFGPDSAMARATKRVCRDCGYFLPLAGSLGVMFGVCGNELAADGHVVDCSYGCGAHSDTPAPQGAGSPLYDAYDDGAVEITETPRAEPEAEAVPVVVTEVTEFDVPVASVEPLEVPVASVEPLEVPVASVEPLEVPVAPVEPFEVPVAPVEPFEVPVASVEPLDVPVASVEPLEVPVAPVEPFEVPVVPVEPLETALDGSIEPLD